MPRISSTTTQLITITRRACLSFALSASASLAFGSVSFAAQPPAFAHWVAAFRARALGRGVSEATYDRVMSAVTPDTNVLADTARSRNSPSRSGNTSTAAARIGASSPAKSAQRSMRTSWHASRRTTVSTATSCSGCGAWSPRSVTSSSIANICGR